MTANARLLPTQFMTGGPEGLGMYECEAFLSFPDQHGYVEILSRVLPDQTSKSWFWKAQKPGSPVNGIWNTSREAIDDAFRTFTDPPNRLAGSNTIP
ncbi:MAG: hypothetical protein OXG35_20925 [Acidobacteria bacterium]|nr:hypothetical protein [Acidobacteriota bacterium]